jgi:polyketide biosynthesis enoyl-CoA hydratase PksH
VVLSSRLEGHLLTLTIDRPEAQNALDAELLGALGEALDRAESDPRVRVVAIAGQPGVFCTGADLAGGAGTSPAEAARLYFRLLRRFTLSPRIVVSVIDGVVQAGGIGLVAASDVAICSESSTFRLPEVLLGLIPACVLPFLMRRIGFQPSYALSLTGQKIDARRALELRLVDHVASDLHDALRRLVLSVERIPEAAVSGLKQYMHQLAPLSEREEDLAVARIAALLEDPDNLRTVRELVHHGLWQERRG